MATGVSIHVVGLESFQRGLDRVPQDAGRQMRVAMTDAVKITHSEIAPRTPVRSGRLRGELYTQVSGGPIVGLQGIVASPTPYAPHVEFGTRPHTIVPRTASVLTFLIDGVRVFTTRVSHPGTAARNMFRDGALAAFPRLPERFRKGWTLVLERVAKSSTLTPNKGAR